MVTQSARDRGKSATAFRTIGEVSIELDLPQHVLRFWETKFTRLKPMKRGGGRRYYRPEDIDLLQRIKQLLYEDGYTIKGVQKLLRDGGAKLDGLGELAKEADVKSSIQVGATTPSAPDSLELGGGKVAVKEAKEVVATGLDGDTRTAIEAIIVELEELRAILKSSK